MKNAQGPRYVDVCFEHPGCLIFVAAMAIVIVCSMLFQKQSDRCQEKGGVLLRQGNFGSVCMKGTVIEY